ncbi:HET-domain-containing protein [Aulographum hederae CBS 113979]|uniref:HET-domain-containing protein n=1 Tax=Aulographum hederae CBS 113979 TaxID=1176131 RepID=A0A6G1H0G0_9PEZI|nr:HET-domain-containing protein [Aulographum hederae CBS 113979]
MCPEENGKTGQLRLWIKEFGDQDICVALTKVAKETPTLKKYPGTWHIEYLGDDRIFALTKQWLDKCLEDHVSCNEHLIPRRWLPTRLIDLGKASSPQLRLCDSSEVPRNSKYMTLSHMWGANKILRLLRKNISSFKQEISASKLSKTFQDAIFITRKCGIRYLWIDSLCIIQDSKIDWKKECVKMGQVYKYSYCNIAASAAPDGKCGCLTTRVPSHMSPLVVFNSNAEGVKNGRCLKEGCWKIGDETIWTRGVAASPLARRAWVVQERFLAPRILHFGRDQVYWECIERRACETYPKAMPSHIDETITSFKGHNWRPGAKNGLSSYMDPWPSIYHVWESIVHTYTRANLTFEDDKLVAISGVARDFQSLMKAEYYAGLWGKRLVQQLLWRVDTPRKRPEKYRAPSWSWISVNGPISNLVEYDEDDAEQNEELQKWFEGSDSESSDSDEEGESDGDDEDETSADEEVEESGDEQDSQPAEKHSSGSDQESKPSVGNGAEKHSSSEPSATKDRPTNLENEISDPKIVKTSSLNDDDQLAIALAQIDLLEQEEKEVSAPEAENSPTEEHESKEDAEEEKEESEEKEDKAEGSSEEVSDSGESDSTTDANSKSSSKIGVWSSSTISSSSSSGPDYERDSLDECRSSCSVCYSLSSASSPESAESGDDKASHLHSNDDNVEEEGDESEKSVRQARNTKKAQKEARKGGVAKLKPPSAHRARVCARPTSNFRKSGLLLPWLDSSPLFPWTESRRRLPPRMAWSQPSQNPSTASDSEADSDESNSGSGSSSSSEDDEDSDAGSYRGRLSHLRADENTKGSKGRDGKRHLICITSVKVSSGSSGSAAHPSSSSSSAHYGGKSKEVPDPFLTIKSGRIRLRARLVDVEWTRKKRLKIVGRGVDMKGWKIHWDVLEQRLPQESLYLMPVIWRYETKSLKGLVLRVLDGGKKKEVVEGDVSTFQRVAHFEVTGKWCGAFMTARERSGRKIHKRLETDFEGFEEVELV